MKIISTEDGSNSIFLEELNETYHSRNGAIQESKHVFLDQGLKFFHSKSSIQNIKIFELGLGTGLNALLTSIESEKLGVSIEYTVLEPFPLIEKIYTQLNFSTILKDRSANEYLSSIHQAEWDKRIKINLNFHIVKSGIPFQEYIVDQELYNIIYYDAFAPNKQAEMWDIELLQKTFMMLKPQGVFVTYCAQGQLKRNLRSVGFEVESLPGPPGKFEMVRAIKP